MTSYDDANGTRREVDLATVRAVVAAMGPPAQVPADTVIAAHPGQRLLIDEPAQVRLEEGETLAFDGNIAPDFPLGYHHLIRGDRSSRLIVSPGVAHLPAGLRGFGWAVQLYAARSARSWGVGDLGDLAWLGRWAAEQGAAMLLLNPLHAPQVATPQQRSPYVPSSRLFRNPLYIRVEDVAGADQAGEVETLARAGRALNAAPLLQRDEAQRLKIAALEAIFARGGGDRDFRAHQAARGSLLEGFATFCAISERRGPDWQRWPADLRRPEGAAVRDFAAANRARVDFHAWLQWLTDVQLRDAAVATPVVNDLAVGCDPGGFDAWLWQDLYAAASTGAPPDFFTPKGQDWGLPPFDPQRLRAAGYEPLIQVLRAAFAHASGVRIDHVMGLFRLWWVPPGMDAGGGAYVRYRHDELLDILALESTRARAFVVGEDLGVVEPGMREELSRRNVLSYRVLWFEPGPPSSYPEHALAAVSTHDLPTVAGLWSGADLDEQAQIGSPVNTSGTMELRQRLRALTGAGDGDPVEEVVGRTYEALAGAPSALLAATLDDAFCAARRPNIPGTVEDRNWSVPLPAPIESLRQSRLARRIAGALRRGG
jgi:4-alpha-glucanotransferase